MKQKVKNSNSSYFLGAISGCVFLFGLMAFVTVLNTGPGISGGKQLLAELTEMNSANAATPAAADPAPLPAETATQGRDYASNPLTIAEKAEMAPKLSSALGQMGGEWQLRSFKRGDLFAFFPTLTNCGLFSGSENGCMPMIPIGSKGMWTYARGDERISGMITYRRSSSAIPEGKIASVPAKPDMYSVIFRAGPPSLSWRGKTMHGKFEIRTREFTDEMRIQMPTLELYHAELEGDGDVQIYLASNTDRATTMAVLDNLDMGLINAMVAPAPYPEDQAIAAIGKREVQFDVLSEAALREKVDGMSTKQRNAYAKGILKDALEKGYTPDDYAITYIALGDAGAADSVALLTGKLSQDHPGYEVLRKEASRSLPLGTCVQTPREMYCGKRAEYVRIYNVIRERLATKRAQTPD